MSALAIERSTVMNCVSPRPTHFFWKSIFHTGGSSSITAGCLLDSSVEISRDFAQKGRGMRLVTYKDKVLGKNVQIYVEEVGAKPISEGFRTLADRWYEEIRMESSLTRMTNKRSYLDVIALEPKAKVISLILEELKSKPAPWFLALKILTKNNDVGREHAGNFNQMAKDWLRWGRENNYIG